MALPLLFQFKHCTIISLSGTSFSRSDLISIQALYDYKSYKYSYVYNLTSFQFKHCTIIRKKAVDEKFGFIHFNSSIVRL